MSAERSSSDSAWSSTTRERDMSAEFTSKKGFSVVAPTSTRMRSSTACSSASCWLRLNRWISSTNRMVRRPLIDRRFSVASISRRRSDTVPPTAETSTKAAFVVSAIDVRQRGLARAGRAEQDDRAELVLLDGRAQPASRPHRLALPTSSSSERGRMRTASGATFDFAAFPFREQRIHARMVPPSAPSVRTNVPLPRRFPHAEPGSGAPATPRRSNIPSRRLAPVSQRGAPLASAVGGKAARKRTSVRDEGLERQARRQRRPQRREVPAAGRPPEQKLARGEGNSAGPQGGDDAAFQIAATAFRG